MEQGNSKHKLITFTTGLIVSAIVLSAAGCFGRLPGTEQDAIEARTSVTEGRALLDRVKSEIAGIFTSVAVLPVAKALMLEASSGGEMTISQLAVTDAYGVYTETAAGVFTHTQDGRSSIDVEFLNGIDASLNNFVFLDAAVNEYKLVVSSDNRQITTPPADFISMNLSMSKPNVDVAKHSDEIQDFSPTLVIYSGTVAYNSNAVRVAYEVVQAGTEIELGYDKDNTNVIVAINRLKTFTVKDATDITAANRSVWNYNESSLFRPTGDPSIWAAVLRTINYNDSNGVKAVMQITTDLRSLVDNTSSVGYNPGPLNNIIYNRRLVADAGGGTYTCDVSNPLSAGAGTPVLARWVDGVEENLMPSAELSCPNSLIKRSAAAMVAAAAAAAATNP